MSSLFQRETTRPPVVTYGLSEEAQKGFFGAIQELSLRPGVRKICEVGGGANPTLPVDFVEENGLDYTVLDISAEELAKTSPGYRKIQADIASPDLHLEGDFDLVFSRWLAEHVEDGRTFHQNVFRLLTNGGIAFHYFPTLYAPPYLVNLILPERATRRILTVLQRNRDFLGFQGKFPARYSWCRGPLRKQIALFESLGYQVEKYTGFFGHSAYYDRMPPIRSLHERFARTLLRHPIPWLTSFAYVLLRKP